MLFGRSPWIFRIFFGPGRDASSFRSLSSRAREISSFTSSKSSSFRREMPSDVPKMALLENLGPTFSLTALPERLLDGGLRGHQGHLLELLAGKSDVFQVLFRARRCSFDLQALALRRGVGAVEATAQAGQRDFLFLWSFWLAAASEATWLRVGR